VDYKEALGFLCKKIVEKNLHPLGNSYSVAEFRALEHLKLLYSCSKPTDSFYVTQEYLDNLIDEFTKKIKIENCKRKFEIGAA
jgi:hypothetical protein